MNHKTFFFIVFFILIVTIVGGTELSFVENYCIIGQDCILNDLFLTGNFSFIGDIINITILNQNVTGQMTIGGSLNVNGNVTADNFFGDFIGGTGNFTYLNVSQDLLVLGNINIGSELFIGNVRLSNQSDNFLWNGSLIITTGISKDGTNVSFVLIDKPSGLPYVIFKPVAPEKGSVITGSLILSSQDLNLNSTNATLCQAHADEDNIELKIDCNSSSPTFTGTGADLYIEGDVQINQEIWLRDTGGEFHFFTRELDLLDELFHNILFNEITASISGTTLKIISKVLEDTLVVNLKGNTTIFDSNSSTVTFLAGTNQSPTLNFINYQNTNNPVLTRTAGDPTVNHADVIRFYAGDSGRSYGSVIDNSPTSEFMSDVTKRFFDEGAIYISGFDMNVSSTFFNTTSPGEMAIIINRHAHGKNFSTDDEYFFVRANGNYNISSDISEIDEYADGATISNNKYFKVTFGIVHGDLRDTILMAVVQSEPVVQYIKVIDAEIDEDHVANLFPADSLLKKLYLPLGSVVMKRTGTTNTIQTLANGQLFVDLRGTITAAGSTPPSTGITNHANLDNLDFASAGHTGFQSSIDGNTNLTLSNITVANLKVNNSPVECPEGSFMTFTNMSTSICVAVSTPTTLWNSSDKEVYLNDSTKSLRIENITSPFTNKSYITFFTDGSVGITLDPVESPPPESEEPQQQQQSVEIKEYTRGTERTCKDGTCNLVLYSGTRFVEQDNTWVDVKDARSLKEFYTIKYLKNDGVHDFEIVELNYTSITLKVFVKDSKEFNKDIPFKVDGVQKVTKRLTSLTDKLTVSFKSDNILSSNYSFGSKSTVIILQDADTENLDDTYIDTELPTNNLGGNNFMKLRHDTKNIMIKFNISSPETIPLGQIIDEANLFLYISSNLLDSSTEGYNTSAHHLYSFPDYAVDSAEWDESVYWDNRPTTDSHYNTTRESSFRFFGGAGEPLGWINWSITNMVQMEYTEGDSNVSIYLITHDKFGLPGGNDYVQFHSKEYSTVSLRPYLEITYSTAPVPDTTPPTYSNFAKNVTDAKIISDSAIQFTITISDADNSVLNWNFSTNLTAGNTWNNITNSTDLTDPSQVNVSIVGKSVGDVFGYMFCASDDLGNVGCDSLRTFTIQKPPKVSKFFVQDFIEGIMFYVDNVGNSWLRGDMEIGGSLTINDSLNVSNTVDLTTLSFRDGTSLTTAPLITTPVWNSSGSNVYLNDNTGRVGIGTDTPLQTLAVVGDGNFTGDLYVGDSNLDQILANRGQPAVPSYSFQGFSRYGMLFDTDGEIKIVLDSNTKLAITSTQVNIGTAGTVSSPGLAYEGDRSTGLFWPATDELCAGAGFIKFWCADENTGQDVMTFNNDGNTGLNTDIDFRIETNNEDNTFFVDSGTGMIGIGTNLPAFPLEVNMNVSGISIYTTGNISANDYITRTSVYDKSRGTALSYIKDTDDLLKAGQIDHSKFYGYVEYDKMDLSRPVITLKNYTEYNETSKKNVTIFYNETSYPYTFKEQGVSLGKEISMLRQSIYELKTELCIYKAYSWC